MTIDKTALKALAEAAPEGPWFGPEYAPGTSYVFDVDLGTLLEYQSIDTEKDACLRYVAAANPAAVLALLAENDQLRIGMKGDYDLDAWLEWSADRDQLNHDHDKWESLYRNEHAAGTRLLDTLTGFRTERDQHRAEVARSTERELLQLAEIEALRKDADRNNRMLVSAAITIGEICEALGIDNHSEPDMIVEAVRELKGRP
jgi:hypothetical protein